ncbi:MAG: hypothetical protein PHT44_01890 [Candidatus Portnoybacteria bacterium]|nr:hypothetical protein [Candidatus Portnoybacteria bacterium]MDD4982655.1 hypothetical protein [Candidatus Portnoybacteria bacterium]
MKDKNQDLFEQVSKKLSALIALSFIEDVSKMTNEKGVEVLNRFGLSNQDIANIIGTTKKTVEVLKSRIKNKKIK